MTTELFKLTLAFRGLSDEDADEAGVEDADLIDDDGDSEDDDDDADLVVGGGDDDEGDSAMEG